MFPDYCPVGRGDAFVITSRTKNWWVVQRDPDGRGLIETGPSKQGWVPAGCLLEVKIPVSLAIEEAANVTRSNPCNSPEQSSSLPILPFNILSTSHPGIGLMDYQKKGDEELDLQKDDALRVFKKHNYWSYVSQGTPHDLRTMLNHHSLTGGQGGHRRSWLGSRLSLFSNVYYHLSSLPLPVIIHR